MQDCLHKPDYALVQNCQSKDMDEKIKSYRLAIFKLDHAERKKGEGPCSKEQSMYSLHKLVCPACHFLFVINCVCNISKNEYDIASEQLPNNAAMLPSN